MKMTVPGVDSEGSGRSSSDEEGAGRAVLEGEAPGADTASLPEEHVYRRMYQLLLERCEVLQQDNERILHRINESKKITKRYKHDVNLLMERLDMYNDGYKTATAESDVRSDVATKPAYKSSSIKPEKQQINKVQIDKMVDKQAPCTVKKPAKRKNTEPKPKAEKDPNAPKKPCNAFFQYCQEQRPIVVAETGGDTGLPELSKQEVTKQLASRWRLLSNEDKKVYVAMFERSKEKYAEEMSAYIRKDIANQ